MTKSLSYSKQIECVYQIHMTISIISCRLIIAAEMIFHSPLSKSAHSCIIKQGGVNVQANMQYYLSKNVGMVCNRCVRFLIFNKCWFFLFEQCVVTK